MEKHTILAMAKKLEETTVTISDIVGELDLGVEIVVMPEHGLRRAVAWVHATEQVDPRPHLRRNELVCTLGSMLVRERSAASFVSALAASGVAGLALGLGEVHLSPPAELVAECGKQDVPLLALPHGVPFLAVNDTILRHRSRIEVEARRQETELLTQLMTAARSGSSEGSLLAAVVEEFGGGFVQIEAGAAPVWRGTGTAPSALFLEQLGSVLELVRLERFREASEGLAQVGQLIALVEQGLAHPAALLPELETIGAKAENLRVSKWPEGCELTLADRWPRALLGVTDAGVVMIAEAADPELFRELGLVCGYSAVVRLGELRRGLNEARSTLRLARRRGGIAGPRALVSFDALLEQQPVDRLIPFVEQLVNPLLEADARGRGDLVRTLTTFIRHGHQVQATAEALYVHVNTVRQRFVRIRELVGRDPLSPDECADLRIALWASERRSVRSRRLVRSLD